MVNPSDARQRKTHCDEAGGCQDMRAKEDTEPIPVFLKFETFATHVEFRQWERAKTILQKDKEDLETVKYQRHTFPTKGLLEMAQKKHRSTSSELAD
eukprot:4919420-Amphidinium_carterae.1